MCSREVTVTRAETTAQESREVAIKMPTRLNLWRVGGEVGRGGLGRGQVVRQTGWSSSPGRLVPAEAPTRLSATMPAMGARTRDGRKCSSTTPASARPEP